MVLTCYFQRRVLWPGRPHSVCGLTPVDPAILLLLVLHHREEEQGAGREEDLKLNIMTCWKNCKSSKDSYPSRDEFIMIVQTSDEYIIFHKSHLLRLGTLRWRLDLLPILKPFYGWLWDPLCLAVQCQWFILGHSHGGGVLSDLWRSELTWKINGEWLNK